MFKISGKLPVIVSACDKRHLSLLALVEEVADVENQEVKGRQNPDVHAAIQPPSDNPGLAGGLAGPGPAAPAPGILHNDITQCYMIIT